MEKLLVVYPDEKVVIKFSLATFKPEGDVTLDFRQKATSAGMGSATHLNAEKFKLQAGIDAVHVPFKGTPEALTDVIGGRNDWFFAPLSSALPLIKDGKLQALAVSTARRSPSLPDVPTTVEAGVPGSDYTFWVGMIVSTIDLRIERHEPFATSGAPGRVRSG